MYSVSVKNSCRCFLKSGMPEEQSFETKEAAQKEAEKMLSVMNSTFCHKHKFVLNEKFGDYTIFIQSS